MYLTMCVLLVLSGLSLLRSLELEVAVPTIHHHAGVGGVPGRHFVSAGGASQLILPIPLQCQLHTQ
jgi:hypothetical protein